MRIARPWPLYLRSSPRGRTDDPARRRDLRRAGPDRSEVGI
jgi:hypothetical protein